MKDQNKLNQLNAYLDFFSDSKNHFYKVSKDISMNPYEYSLEVTDFIRYAENDWTLKDFDWASWTDEFKQYEFDTKKIKSADESTLRKILTVIVRGERVNAGLLAKAIDSGLLLSVLKGLRGGGSALESKAAKFFTFLFVAVGIFVLYFSQTKQGELDRWTSVFEATDIEDFKSVDVGADVILQNVKLPDAGTLGNAAEQNFVLFRKYRIASGGVSVPKTYNSNRRESIGEYLPDLQVMFADQQLLLLSKGASFLMPFEKDDKGAEHIVDSIGQVILSGYQGSAVVTVFASKNDASTISAKLICSKDKDACLGDITYYRYMSLLFVVISWSLAFMLYRYAKKKQA